MKLSKGVFNDKTQYHRKAYRGAQCAGLCHHLKRPPCYNGRYRLHDSQLLQSLRAVFGAVGILRRYLSFVETVKRFGYFNRILAHFRLFSDGTMVRAVWAKRANRRFHSSIPKRHDNLLARANAPISAFEGVS